MKRFVFPLSIFFIALFTALKVSGGHTASFKNPQDKIRYQAAEHWADSVMATLDLRQRVAQLVFPRFDIKNDAAGRAVIARNVTKYQIGGFLLGKGTLSDYKGIIDYARSLSKVPLLVTLDGEWGLAMRVTDAPRFPYNMTLGAIDNPDLIEKYGEEVARECRLVGINVNFAPVLDVNSNPENPVIGTRSFGEDPHRVAELGAAYSRGLEKGGVMSVAKHFPGHGDTQTDSHKTLPVIKRSAHDIEKLELVPFEKYIEEGYSGVMVGHLDIPALDPSRTPASLSQPIVTNLLKRKMGFEGLVWTDALAMKGAGSNENNCIRALNAGVDVLLQPANTEADIEAIIKAVKSDKIKESVINERCRKLLIYKYMFVVNPIGDAPAKSGNINKSVNNETVQSINQQLADASVTVLKNKDDILPLRDLAKRNIVLLTLGAKSDNLFTTTCKKYADCKVIESTDGRLTSEQVNAVEQANTVIVSLFAQNQQVLSALQKIYNNNAEFIAVSFLSPYKTAKLKVGLQHMNALVTTFDNTPELQRSAAEVVFGGLGARGKLPVNLQGWFKLGKGIDTHKTRLGYSTPEAAGLSSSITQRYDSLITEAIATGAFPGCQVVVAKDGNIVYDKSFGSLNPDKASAVTDNTLFDIASVTKVAGTVSALMRAYDEGKWDLNDPISKFIPELKGTSKEKITMRQLLMHESGLPSGLRIYEVLVDSTSFTGRAFASRPDDDFTIKLQNNVYLNKNVRLKKDLVSNTPTPQLPIPIGENVYVGQATFDAIRKATFTAPLKSQTYRYSDLNFILLMMAVEKMEGKRLDEMVEEDVFAPMGAYRTMFIPKQKGIKDSEIAPTERDPFLRHQLIQGYVHDETSAFSGGVQGNAGLFSTAEDLAKLCQTWLDGGTYGDERIFSEKTVKMFTDTRSKSGKRALGFDTAPPKSGAGSKNSYGHMGFTGTQIKIDPDNNLIFVFLSNRVNPTRDNAAFARSDIRGKLWAELYR